jgi:hypothetical protein
VSSSAADLGIWTTIAEEAGRESALWSAALRPDGDRDETPVFSALADGRSALGLESIYEGYLLHYGKPRLFAPADSDTAILLGDYLYAHGLVRVAALLVVASLCVPRAAAADEVHVMTSHKLLQFALVLFGAVFHGDVLAKFEEARAGADRNAACTLLARAPRR